MLLNMKPAKLNLILCFLLLLAVFTFNGCSGGGEQPGKTSQPSASVDTEEEEEEEEEEVEGGAAPVSAYDNWQSNKGIGPVKSLVLSGDIDQAMVEEGAKIYKEKCTSCHKPDKRFIGPSPKGIFERRTPEWVMNMILNPEQMVKEDPIAKQLLLDYNLSPMANQNLTEEEARKVVEYFRSL